MEFVQSLKCPLGFLIIGGNESSIGSIMFSDEEIPSSKSLPILANMASNQFGAYFSGHLHNFNLPFHMTGTNFQQSVWKQIAKIEIGTTCNYLNLANRLGDKHKIRAVGNANGKNNLALLIPCHREIGESGKLVGYAGGLWRKQWLLEHESKMIHGVQTLF